MLEKNNLKNTCLYIFIFLFQTFILKSQEVNVKYTEDKIEIDGSPNDSAWKNADVASDFWQWRPTDSVKAIKQTEFKAFNSLSRFLAFLLFLGVGAAKPFGRKVKFHLSPVKNPKAFCFLYCFSGSSHVLRLPLHSRE